VALIGLVGWTWDIEAEHLVSFESPVVPPGLTT
jgi:hypothetical protein